MRITEDAVYRAIQLTDDARSTLENNFNYMRSSVTPMLNEWKDNNVQQFLELLDHFDSYVKVTAGNMERINESLRALLQAMAAYNN